jgi:hypothetical protein
MLCVAVRDCVSAVSHKSAAEAVGEPRRSRKHNHRLLALISISDVAENNLFIPLSLSSPMPERTGPGFSIGFWGMVTGVMVALKLKESLDDCKYLRPREKPKY